MIQSNNCTYPEHNNYPIQGFCLNLACKVTAQCCSLCPQDNHKLHKNDCKNSVETKKMIQKYNEMLCNWKKSLENSQMLEEKTRKYISKQTQIVIELHEKMKTKSLQTLISEIQRVKLWNNHLTISSKLENNNIEGIIQKLKEFEESMKAIDETEEDKQKGFFFELFQNYNMQRINNLLNNSFFWVFSCLISGQQLQKKENHQQSIQYFDKAINLISTYADAYMSKGDSLHDMKRNEEALECFDKAMIYYQEEGKNHLKLTALWKKGNALQDSKDYENALNCYDQVLLEEPDYYIVNQDKGVLLQSLKMDNEAIVCFDLVINANNFCFDALSKKGTSLNSLKRYDEAIECFNQAINIHPNDVETLLEKATSLKLLGRYEEALACLDEILKINPSNRKARKRKGFLLKKYIKQNEQSEPFDWDKWHEEFDDDDDNQGMRQSIFCF